MVAINVYSPSLVTSILWRHVHVGHSRLHNFGNRAWSSRVTTTAPQTRIPHVTPTVTMKSVPPRVSSSLRLSIKLPRHWKFMPNIPTTCPHTPKTSWCQPQIGCLGASKGVHLLTNAPSAKPDDIIVITTSTPRILFLCVSSCKLTCKVNYASSE